MTLIKREDAIEAVREEYEDAINIGDNGDAIAYDVGRILSALPSADAEPMTEKVREALMRLSMCAREECVICKYKDKCNFDFQYEESTKNMNTILDSLMKSKCEVDAEWIPFTRRPMTEEEQKDYPNCTFMFNCVLPDDGDEILISNGRFVWMDAFCNDIDGCYLDSGDDIDEDMAWMPLPKPYKGGDDE